MGYEQAKLRGAASYVSWVVTRTLSLTTRQSARRDPYGRLPDALGMCDDLRWAGLALARLLRKFFQNLRYGRERPKVARKLRSLAGGWAPLYGRAAAEEIFSEVI